ncbi:hypothetical protein RclHR1_00150013 [Rhizophagus clarus]|uniref:P-loop containing nucleoside triphosphate hydrolase protein n=1 Tax=Rhizophagus clarus TaxID=94130 RepID=A0A2Z6QDY2_9GLOM|nr:hypothetical protein RclHR1_00150013 [Rhizophagus clarus]GET02294.1 P-loop containing nucleoside triphosphate hydrolase protein [Rhizophagus clarus]
MEAHLNCVFLGKPLSDSFIVDLNKINTIDGSNINYDDLKIGHIKTIIWNKKKKTLSSIEGFDLMILWKVDIALRDKLKDFNEQQIGNKGVELVFIDLISEYFPNKNTINKSLIIIQPSIDIEKRGHQSAIFRKYINYLQILSKLLSIVKVERCVTISIFNVKEYLNQCNYTTRWNTWFRMAFYIYQHLDYIRGFYDEENKENPTSKVEK